MIAQGGKGGTGNLKRKDIRDPMPGTKGEEMIFTADVTDFGMLDLIISDAKLVAKVTEKTAIFGIVYTLTGLERFDATVCAMKQKDGQIEHIIFDNKDRQQNHLEV